MHTISQSTDSDRYARCIRASKRVRWDIDEDVIQGRRFDRSQKLRACQCPLACQGLHPFEVLRPIVQCRRVKICAIRPHQRMDLRIKLDLLEE
jgi:hypothetical protein